MEDRSPLDPSEYDPKLSEERLARLVRLAARAFNRSLQLRLHTEGVSFGQWIFLRILWYDDGLSQRELSQRAHLTEPTGFCRKASWPSRFPCRSPIYFSFQKLRR